MRTIISLLKRKRIWVINFILPFLFGFFLMNALGKNISQTMNSVGTTIKAGIVNLAGDNELINQISKRKDIKIIEGITKDNIEKKLKENEINVGVIIPSNFNNQIFNDKNTTLKLFHKGYNHVIEDFVSSITEFENQIIAQRLDSLNVSKNYINPITVEDKNISNIIAKIDNNFKNFIPVLLFIFAFLGLIFPCSSTLYNVVKKDTLGNTPLWDRLLGVSFLSIITVLILVASFWASIWTTSIFKRDN